MRRLELSWKKSGLWIAHAGLVLPQVLQRAIELIAKHLRTAVNHGDDLHAREQMAYAQFLAGMAFNNALLGYVHAMAHQLGGQYNLPHGVCNALLLPHAPPVLPQDGPQPARLPSPPAMAALRAGESTSPLASN